MAGPMTGAVESRTERAGLTAPVHPWRAWYPASVDEHQRLAPDPACKLLDDAAACYGARPSKDFLGRSLSYHQIGTRVDRAAAGPQPVGGGKGAKVGWFLPHCQTFVVYYLAVPQTRGAVFNYNPLYAHEELTFQVCGSETSFMLTLDLVALCSVALRRHAEGKTSHIEMPAAIELPETLPKTMIGKLSRKELNAEQEARRERK